MAHLALYLFGPFHAALDGQEITGFATDKCRALLAYLAAEADRPHRRDALAGLLWPDLPQERARQSLRQTLSRVRQSLDDRDPNRPFLLVRQECVQFSAASDSWLDVAAFTTLLADCKTHAHRSIGACRPCLERLQRAVALYRGDLLDQFFLPDSAPFEEWALFKRDGLRQQALEALAILAAYHERRADYTQAQQYARRQVELEPWCEEAHRQLMRLLSFAGERTAALAQYESCRRILAAELGVEPAAEAKSLHTQIQSGRPPPNPVRLHNLPASWDSFVGRQRELAELSGLLAAPDCRLVTLTGPGGVGKTRLALQSAAEHVGVFAHGVWFVPLADASDGGQVAAAITESLNLAALGREDPREQVLNYLRDKELLLLLDGMEHVLPAADLLAMILRRAPRIVFLVTSRERLHLREEWVYDVSGLGYPEAGDVSAVGGDVSAGAEGRPYGEPLEKQYGAFELYVRRACQWNRRFSPASELPAILRICRLVEGMPLGLELAAAAGRPCAEVAEEIERNLAVLTTTLRNVPARHASISAAIEHSWRVLSDAQRQLFARLSVFQDGWTNAAAAAVTAAGPADLQELEHKSLLRRNASGRWQMHALLRQFAAERLAEWPSVQSEACARHAACYLGLLEHHAAGLDGRTPAAALAVIAADLENVRRAWRWAVERRCWTEIARGLDGLARFYLLRGPFREGAALFHQAAEALAAEEMSADRRFLLARLLAEESRALDLQGHYPEAVAAAQSAVGHAAAAEADGIQGARAVHALARMLWGQSLLRMSDYDAARPHLEAAVALAQGSGLAGIEAAGRRNLGNLSFFLGDFQEARGRYEQVLELYRQVGDGRGESTALNNLGGVYYQQGDFAQARHCYARALAIRQEMGDRWGEGSTLLNLGHLAYAEGNLEQAGLDYRQALEIVRALGDRRGEGLTLINLGANDADQGNYAAAAAAYEAALEILREIDDRRGAAQTLAFLGTNCIHYGDHARSRACLDEAYQLFGEMDDARGEGEVLTHLARLSLVTEAYTAAREYAELALRIAGKISDPRMRGYGLTLLGHALAGQGLGEEAGAAYRQAQAVCEEFGLRPRQWEARAGLAGAALAAGRLAEAREEALAVSAALTAEPAAQSVPLQVYLDCRRVLRACGEAARAEALLARAYDLLRERAARIGDPALRRAFLKNVAAHREIAHESERANR